MLPLRAARPCMPAPADVRQAASARGLHPVVSEFMALGEGALHVSSPTPARLRLGVPRNALHATPVPSPAAEDVELGEGALETLSRVSGGDMRKAITSLQVSWRAWDRPVAVGSHRPLHQRCQCTTPAVCTFHSSLSPCCKCHPRCPRGPAECGALARQPRHAAGHTGRVRHRAWRCARMACRHMCRARLGFCQAWGGWGSLGTTLPHASGTEAGGVVSLPSCPCPCCPCCLVGFTMSAPRPPLPSEAVAGLLAAARSGRFDAVQTSVQGLIAEGYPAQEILLQLQAALLEDGAASDSGGREAGVGGWVGGRDTMRREWGCAQAGPAQSRSIPVLPTASVHTPMLSPLCCLQPRARFWGSWRKLTRTWWTGLMSTCSSWPRRVLRSVC